jgi:hypothetical protein
MMAGTHRSIQRRLVHQRASFDAEKSAHVRVSLGQHSGVWSVGDNSPPGVNSPPTRWVGSRPRSKDGSRPVFPVVSATPSRAMVSSPVSSLQCDAAFCHIAKETGGSRSPAPSLFDLSPEQTMRPAVHRLAVPRKLRTDRRLARLRSHERGPLTRRKRATHSPPPRKIAGHEHLVIVGDRDRSKVERLVV